MKIKYLGTAAAEGIPALFCDCEVCQQALSKKGRNIRTRSQAVIDDVLLIDLPADTYMHMLHGMVDLRKIKNLIITHSHEDHLYERDLGNRFNGFAHLKDKFPLNVYATKVSIDLILEHLHQHPCYKDDQDDVLCNEITPYSKFKAGKYEITPLKANHNPKTMPVIFIISDEQKSILYANDTGYFPQDTWEYLQKIKPYFNFISLDCTCVLNDVTNSKMNGHMNFTTVKNVIKNLNKIGCIDEKTKICVNHFSHNGLVSYDELIEMVKEDGFLVSYDGMEVEV